MDFGYFGGVSILGNLVSILGNLVSIPKTQFCHSSGKNEGELFYFYYGFQYGYDVNMFVSIFFIYFGNKTRRTLLFFLLITREQFCDDLDLPIYGTFERYLSNLPKKCFGFWKSLFWVSILKNGD